MIEQIDVRRRAGHEHVDHAFGARGEMKRLERSRRLQGRGGAARGKQLLIQERRERQGAQSGRAASQERAARRDFVEIVKEVHFVMVSFKFNSTLATPVQAARIGSLASLDLGNSPTVSNSPAAFLSSSKFCNCS